MSDNPSPREPIDAGPIDAGPIVAGPIDAGPIDAGPIDAEIVPAASGAPAPLPAPDYDDRGVPSLAHVRNKIESRLATSVGAQELADETPQGRSLAEQEAERAEAATAKLAEIRRSLGR